MPSAIQRRLFMGPPWTPYGLPNTAARYSLDGAASDSTYLIDGSNRLMLVADRSGNSATTAIVCNGGASNSVTASTKSVTGNQVFSAQVKLSTYTPAANVTLASKTSGNNGFEWLLLTTGIMRLTIGDGASLTNYDSTVGMSAGVFADRTLTATYVDGGSGSVIFAVDGVQLGTTVATTKTLTNAATSLTIGMANTIGSTFRVQVGSVYDCNPSAAAKLAATFSSGGDTYTVNTSGDLGARICGVRDLYQGTQAKQPIFTASGSGNYATFDGSNDYMGGAFGALLSTEATIFLIFKSTQGNGTYGMPLRIQTTSQEVFVSGINNAFGLPANSLFTARRGQTQPYFVSSAITSQCIVSATYTFSGNTWVDAVNNVAQSLMSGGTAGGTANETVVGCDAGAIGFFSGAVSEIVIFSSSYSAPIVSRCVQYFARKWGATI